MKKTKNLQFLLVSACLCSTFVMACACGGNGGSGTQTKDGVTLDLFEKTTLDASSLTGDIVWASSDDTVVSVEGGVVTPHKEGTAEITATAGKNTVKYPVTVEDSGARPSISKIDDVTIYETQEYNLYEHLTTTYKSEAVMEGVTYSYKATSDKVTVNETTGVITGAKEGIDQVSVSATYMGYSIPKKICNVTVLSANYVEPTNDKVSISTVEGDIDPTSVTLSAKKVVVNAQEVKDAAITATVVSGAEFVTLDGLKVTAKDIGTAVIELSATANGKTVKGTVTVTVHDDKVSYNPNFFANTGTAAPYQAKIERVTEGEEAGSYRYTSTNGSFWNRALIDSTNISQIIQKGYKAFTYKVKLASAGTFSAYIPSALASVNGTIKAPVAENAQAEDAVELLVAYDEAGNRVDLTETQMEQGKWYTLVYDLTTYEDGWAFLGFTLGGVGCTYTLDDKNQPVYDGNETYKDENEGGEQTAYFKDFNWCTTGNLLPGGGYDATHAGAFDEEDPNVTAEKDAFMNSVTIASAGAKLEKVTSGDFFDSSTDTYKWMSKVGGYAGRMTFNDVHDGEFKPQSFFKDGKHYISFEVFLQSGSGIMFCNWPAAVDGDTSQHQEGVIDAQGAHDNQGKPLDSIHVFNRLNRRSGLRTGDWYTVVMEVEYETEPVWTFQWVGITGSKYSPATAYLRNFKFSEEMPVEEVIPGESEKYGVDAAMVEDLKEGETDIVKFTGKAGGNYYENRLFLTEVTSDNAQPQATYFESDNQYITFKIRPEKDVQIGFVVGYAWTDVAVDLIAENALVRVRDSEGRIVDKCVAMPEIDGFTQYYVTLSKGEWYTVVIHLAHEGTVEAPAQCGMRFRTSTDPIASFKGLTYSVTDPLEGEQPPEPEGPTEADRYSVAAGGAKVAMGTEDGFTDAVKYTNAKDWYLGRVTFAEMGDAETLQSNGSYYTEGYKFVSFKLYAKEETVIYARLGALDKSQNGLLSHGYEIKAYDADMNEVTGISAGAWYTVVIRREAADDPFYISTEVPKDADQNPIPTELYFKDLAFHKAWPIEGVDEPQPPVEEGTPEPDEETDPAKIEDIKLWSVVEGGAEKVTLESDRGYVKYTSMDSAYNARLCFTYLNDAGLTLGKFYADGNRYVSFEIYCMESTTIAAYTNLNWGTGADNLTVLTHPNVKVYNAQGTQVTTELEKGVWYKVVMDIGAVADTLPKGEDGSPAAVTASFVYVGLTGTEAKPQVAYLRGLSYVKSFDYPELPEELDYEILQGFETADSAEIQSTDESGDLIADTFEAGTLTTDHSAKNNAVTFSTVKKNQLFRIKLLTGGVPYLQRLILKSTANSGYMFL